MLDRKGFTVMRQSDGYEPMTDLSTDELRQQIDALDDELMRIWQRRATISRIIGGRRMASGEPRIILNREYEIMSTIQKSIDSPGCHSR